MNNISEQERLRRQEYARDSRAALAQGLTVDKRLEARDAKADAWAKWLRWKMDSSRCSVPVALLPDILAQMEQLVDDRVAPRGQADQGKFDEGI